MAVKVVGLDLAKDVFQVHSVSAAGRRIINMKITRAKLLAFFETLPRCVIAMEAGGSAHHWGRDLVVRQRTQVVNTGSLIGAQNIDNLQEGVFYSGNVGKNLLV